MTTPSKPSLSQNEQRIYDYVVSYQQLHHRWPSVEQIRQGLEISGSGAVMSVLGRLQERGVLPTTYRFSHSDMTPAQHAVYWFIVEYKTLHDGSSPSIREIMLGTHYKSTCPVWRTVLQLHDMGLIQVDSPKARTIRVRGGSYQYLPPAGVGAAA